MHKFDSFNRPQSQSKFRTESLNQKLDLSSSWGGRFTILLHSDALEPIGRRFMCFVDLY